MTALLTAGNELEWAFEPQFWVHEAEVKNQVSSFGHTLRHCILYFRVVQRNVAKVFQAFSGPLSESAFSTLEWRFAKLKFEKLDDLLDLCSVPSIVRLVNLTDDALRALLQHFKVLSWRAQQHQLREQVVHVPVVVRLPELALVEVYDSLHMGADHEEAVVDVSMRVLVLFTVANEAV